MPVFGSSAMGGDLGKVRCRRSHRRRKKASERLRKPSVCAGVSGQWWGGVEARREWDTGAGEEELGLSEMRESAETCTHLSPLGREK